MDFLKKAGIKRWIFITLILIIIIVILGFVTKSFWFPKVSCVFPVYKSAGTEVSKSYPDKYLAPEEWKQYQDSEVLFCFTPGAQDFFSQKISSLRGYGGLAYSHIDESVKINKAYNGKDCVPLRYYYEIFLRGTISGEKLSSSPFGRLYFEDNYTISVAYQPNNKRWQDVSINLVGRHLIPADALNRALAIAQNNDQFKDIISQGYQPSDLYWNPKNQYTKSDNDTIALVYSKVIDREKNITSYFTIEIDNFANKIISENKEEKTTQ